MSFEAPFYGPSSEKARIEEAAWWASQIRRSPYAAWCASGVRGGRAADFTPEPNPPKPPPGAWDWCYERSTKKPPGYYERNPHKKPSTNNSP